MAFLLGDIFIGDFPITQNFGARPDIYSARYGLRGHNGLDFGCPSLTMVLSAADGKIMEKGFDAGGYGNYIKILHDGYLTLYGHLNDIVVNLNDKVVAGQLVAHSNNTGFSDGPHLHFGVAPCDTIGNKTEPANGYSGYIDPQDETKCTWDVKNLKQPVVPQPDAKPPVQVPFEQYPIIIAEGTNYKTIATYLLSNGLNEYLATVQQTPVDLVASPGDPGAGQKIVMYLSELIQELKTLNQAQKQNKLDVTVSPTDVKAAFSQQVDTALQDIPQSQQQSFLGALLQFFTTGWLVKKN